MRVDGRHYRTIWATDDGSGDINIIDQTRLPFEFVIARLRTVAEAAEAKLRQPERIVYTSAHPFDEIRVGAAAV